MKQEVVLDCGEANKTPVYCVWFGPVQSPMPEFSLGVPVAKAEFLAALKRFDKNYTTYVIRTVKMASSPDEDRNPPDRYSQEFIRPNGRLFRVWILHTHMTSLVVRANDPGNVAPVVVGWLSNNEKMGRIQKVTELPLYIEDDDGEECGDLDYRRFDGPPKTAGDFDIVAYASIFDDRRKDEDRKHSKRRSSRR
jgi:hypothetical protein